LELLRKNLAGKTNNFEDIDKEFAFTIWVIEKDFNTGLLDENYPLMKFLNIVDKENVERWKSMNETDNSRNLPKTIGGY